MRLPGRRGIVTGASSGIGRAIAIALANEGVSLCLAGRDKDRLEAAQAACRSSVARTAAVAGDLTQPGAIETLAAAAEREFASIDVLVHSAGIYARGTHAETDAAGFRHQLEANLIPPWRLTKRLLPTLRDVVFINSSQGLAAAPGVGHFAATQHALKAVADCLREEVNAAGVRVLTIHVGRTATPRQERIFAQEGRHYAPERLMQPEDVAAVVIAALALPRTAEMTSVSVRSMQKP
jgi:short-subunit dehydrogenase